MSEMLRKENVKIPDLKSKLAEFESEKAELKKYDVENAELKFRVKKLEARLAIVEQSSVIGQTQNNEKEILEVLLEVSAVDDSVVQPK
ncbi:15378_t:CDS:2 [Funneliformis geosporum]|nr:15378_t:CDS:2 [Funneliformis geosporum]